MLAKRLIYGQSMSMDAEEAMINKLKVYWFKFINYNYVFMLLNTNLFIIDAQQKK